MVPTTPKGEAHRWDPRVEPCTRIGDSEGGEREVGGDPDSGHHMPTSPPHSPESASNWLRGPQTTNPNLGCKFPNLSKLVEHLWRGSPTKTYAVALQATPAKVVQVMNGGGGGRRCFGRDGFAACSFARIWLIRYGLSANEQYFFSHIKPANRIFSHVL